MKFKNIIIREAKLLFIYLFIGFVVYQTLIINELPNPDSIWNGMFYKDSWLWECRLGRFMIWIFQSIFGNLVNPATNVLICIGILSVICIVINDIFEIKDKILKAILGVFVILSPSMGGTLTYHYCSVYYLIAYLLAVLSCWLIFKTTGVKNGGLASIMLCCSLGTYQAYIGIVAVVGLIYIIQMMIDNSFSKEKLIKHTVKFFCVIVMGILLYLVVNKCVLSLLNISAEAGRGFSQMGRIPLKQLPQLLLNCYSYTREYFFGSTMLNNHIGKINMCGVNVIWSVFLILVSFFKVITMKKELCYKISAIIGIVLLPVAIMCITVVASDVSIYESTGLIMLPTTVYMYIFLIVLLNINIKEQKNVKYLYKISLLISIIIIVSFYNLSSAMQTYQRVALKRMNYVAQNIARQVEKYIYLEEKYSICIVGNINTGNYPEIYNELAEVVSWTTASYGMVWEDYNGSQNCWRNFISQYCGVQYISCSEEDYYEIIETEEFEKAPLFPCDGSVYMHDNRIVVVKLSDEN